MAEKSVQVWQERPFDYQFIGTLFLIDFCMADRDIAEALDEIANNTETTKGKYRSDIFDEKVLYFRKIQRKERKTTL